MVIVYYSAQVKLASSWLLKKTGYLFQVRSIDGSQGKEAPIVIVDTVTLSGRYPLGFVDGSQGKEAPIVIVDTVTPGDRYPLGFVADKKRMDVTLARAQSGRIIISNARMADNTWASETTNLWLDLSREHKRDGGMWAATVKNREIREEMAIPGPGIGE